MTNSYVNNSMLDMTEDLLGMLRVRLTNSEGVGKSACEIRNLCDSRTRNIC